MLKKGYPKKTLLALALYMTLTAPTTAFAGTGITGEYRQGEILSLGSSLNRQEEAEMREHFGVSNDMKAIYVDNATVIEQLGLEKDALNNYTGGWYSSAYVKLTNKGGVNVTSSNVNLVTNEMFANALITSGILNCEVNVSAPFMVTGESALSGILAGAEEIMGESLPEENKVVAKEEIDTTLEIADEILNDTTNEINNSGDSSTIASGIINDIKQQVIKDSPNSTQIQEIIINVTNNYGVELSEETNARVLSLMKDVNKLDIEYKDIKDTMKNIGDNISESLKEAGVKLKESGFFEKIGNWISELFTTIGNWFKELFLSIGDNSESLIEDDNGSTEDFAQDVVDTEEIIEEEEIILDEVIENEEAVLEEEVIEDVPTEEIVEDELSSSDSESWEGSISVNDVPVSDANDTPVSNEVQSELDENAETVSQDIVQE